MRAEFHVHHDDGALHIWMADLDLPEPPEDASLEPWAREHLYPLTAHAHPSPDKTHRRVTIVYCSGREDLVGEDFDWIDD